jgi:DNA-binding MarR family transcriptional regulator
MLYALVEATYNIVEQTEANILGVLTELGLTRPLADVVWELNPSQPPKTMGELATALKCEPSTATFLVDRLHEKGLVERGSDARDRRRTTVALTENGRSVNDVVVRAVHDSSPVLQLTTEDMATVLGIFRKVLGDSKPKYKKATE